jgi:hypothetical protein
MESQNPGEPLSDAVMAALDAIMVSVGAIRDDLSTTHVSTNGTLHSLAIDFQSCLDTARQLWPKLGDDSDPLAMEWQTVTLTKEEHHQCREQEIVHAHEAIGQGACATFLDSFPAKPSFTFKGLDELMSRFNPDTFATKAKSCSSAVTSYKTSVPECKAKQHAFEDASCSFHKKFAKAHNSCVEIQNCRAIDGAELSKSCSSALESAIAWNTAEGSLQQIECMLRKLKESNFNTTEECSHEAATWDEYDIQCPHVTGESSEEKQCTQAAAMHKGGAEALVPSDVQWLDSMYKTQDWFESASNDAEAQGPISALMAECDVPDLATAQAGEESPAAEEEVHDAELVNLGLGRSCEQWPGKYHTFVGCGVCNNGMRNDQQYHAEQWRNETFKDRCWDQRGGPSWGCLVDPNTCEDKDTADFCRKHAELEYGCMTNGGSAPFWQVHLDSPSRIDHVAVIAYGYPQNSHSLRERIGAFYMRLLNEDGFEVAHKFWEDAPLDVPTFNWTDVNTAGVKTVQVQVLGGRSWRGDDYRNGDRISPSLTFNEVEVIGHESTAPAPAALPYCTVLHEGSTSSDCDKPGLRPAANLEECMGCAWRFRCPNITLPDHRSKWDRAGAPFQTDDGWCHSLIQSGVDPGEQWGKQGLHEIGGNPANRPYGCFMDAEGSGRFYRGWGQAWFNTVGAKDVQVPNYYPMCVTTN